MKSWIDRVVESTRENESPERYFWWGAVAAIAATMGKRVFLDRHFYKLYPNIYVIIVSAKSGLRKGIPVSMVKTMLSEVGNGRIISGENSIEGIIHEFSQQRTLESGIVLNKAQGILLSDELASFMVDSDSALTILTALHNTHEHEKEWRKTLKNSPNEVLKEPCITMFTASNERLFEEVVKSKDMEGGFIARSFIVYESKRRTINSLMRKPVDLVPWSELAQHLKTLKDISGEFKITELGVQAYDDWYHDLAGKDFEDRTGSIERLGDQVLKLAMNLSLSYGTDLVITDKILAEAIEHAQTCISSGTKQISMGQGQSEVSVPTAKVLKALIKAPEHQLTRQRLLKKLWPDIDSYSLDRVLETLFTTGAVESERSGRDVIYRMPEKVFQEYTRFKGEEQ